MRVLAVWPRIQVWVNGTRVTDYWETDMTIAHEGMLALQVRPHGLNPQDQEASLENPDTKPKGWWPVDGEEVWQECAYKNLRIVDVN